MQSNHGSFTVAQGATGSQQINTGFSTPRSVWFLAYGNPADLGDPDDLAVGWGVIASNTNSPQVNSGQIAYGTHQEHNNTSTRARSQIDRGVIILRGAQFGLAFKAQASMNATGFAFDTTVAEIGATIYWWALDEDGGVSVHNQTENFASASFNSSMETDGAAFDAQAWLCNPNWPGTAEEENQSLDGMSLGDGTRDLCGQYCSKHNVTGVSAGTMFYDTDTDAGAGAARTFTQQDAFNPENYAGIARLSYGGAVDTTLGTVTQSGTTSRANYAALGARGAGEVGIAKFTCPSGAGDTVAVSFPFQVGFAKVVVLQGFENDGNGNSIPIAPSNIKCGVSRGLYTPEGQRSISYTDNGAGTTDIRQGDTATVCNFTFPYTGTATLVPTAGGCDLVFSGYSGQAFRGVIVAIGEPSAETQLDADPVTLGWTASDAEVTEEAVLDGSAAAFAWSASDASVEPFNLVADSVALGWSGTNAQVDSLTTLDVEAVTLAIVSGLAIVDTSALLDADPAAFAWTAGDAVVDTVSVLDAQSAIFNFASGNATVTTPEAQLDAEGATLGWLSQEAEVLTSDTLGGVAAAFAWQSSDAVVDVPTIVLDADSAMFSWVSQNASVVDDPNLLSADSLAFSWTSTDAGIAVDELFPDAVTLSWFASEATIFVPTVDEHGFLVTVLRPDSLDVQVYNAYRRTRKTPM